MYGEQYVEYTYWYKGVKDQNFPQKKMSQFIIVHRAPAGKLSLRIVFNPLSGHTHIKKQNKREYIFILTFGVE